MAECKHVNIVWDTADLKECTNTGDLLGIPCVCADCGEKFIEWYIFDEMEGRKND